MITEKELENIESLLDENQRLRLTVQALEKELREAKDYINELEESGNIQYSSRYPIIPTDKY